MAADPSPRRSYTLDDYDAELRSAADDARALADGLSAADGIRPPAPGRWSVAHCLAHLAATTRLYLPRSTRRSPAGAPPAAPPPRPSGRAS
jgi:hypothetical protein